MQHYYSNQLGLQALPSTVNRNAGMRREMAVASALPANGAEMRAVSVEALLPQHLNACASLSATAASGVAAAS